MKAQNEHPDREAPLTPAEIAADARLEALLDEALAAHPGDAADRLPDDFTARVLSGRPFAPWEVRRASVWRTPVLIFSALVILSAGAFVLPLVSLGPGSAVALWAWVTLTAVTRPLAALAAAVRLLPDAGGAVRHAVPAGVTFGLGAGALASLGATALLALRPARRAARAARD